MPVSVCLGLGTNQSAHVGDSELSRYVDYINEDSQVSVSVAAGNEGAAQHHYTAELDYVKNQDTVELRIADKEEGFSMEFWGDPPDDYGISLQSPAGEKLYVSSSLGAGTQELSFCGDESAGQLRKDGADDRETADLFSLLSSGSRYLEGKCQ